MEALFIIVCDVCFIVNDILTRNLPREWISLVFNSVVWNNVATIELNINLCSYICEIVHKVKWFVCVKPLVRTNHVH